MVHLTDIRTKIADLQAMESVLAETVVRCADGKTPECPLLETLFGSIDPSARPPAGWSRRRPAQTNVGFRKDDALAKLNVCFFHFQSESRQAGNGQLVPKYSGPPIAEPVIQRSF